MPEYGKKTPDEIKKEILKHSLEKNPNIPNVIASAIFNGSDQKIYELNDTELAQLLRTSPKQKINEFYDELLLHPERYNDEYINLVLAPYGYSSEELHIFLQIIRKSISIQTSARIQTIDYAHKSAEELMHIATSPREPAIVEFTFFHKEFLHTIGELAYILELCDDPRTFNRLGILPTGMINKLLLIESNDWLHDRIIAIQKNMITRAENDNIRKIPRTITDREVQSYRTYLVKEAERLSVLQAPKSP